MAQNEPTQEADADFSVQFDTCFRDVVRDGRWNDLKLVVGPDGSQKEEFACSAVILAARSKFVRRMLPRAERSPDNYFLLYIPDMTPDQFRPVLEYLLTDDMSSFSTVEELVFGLYAGKKLENAPMVKRCREKLRKCFEEKPVENALILLKHEKRFVPEDEESQLFWLTKQVLDDNIKEVLEADGLLELDFQQMKKIVGNQSSNAKSLDRMKALSRWTERRLQRKNVDVNQKAKLDLCSEVLVNIPVQELSIDELYDEVDKLGLLADETLLLLTRNKYASNDKLPFIDPNNFVFNSNVDEDWHKHDAEQYSRRAIFKWNINQNDYTGWTLGHQVVSEPFSTDADSTQWVVELCPVGFDESKKDSIGTFVSIRSMDSRYSSLHYHCRFEIIADGKRMVSKEITDVESYGYSSFTNRDKLPTQFTLVAKIQWAPGRSIFDQKSTQQLVDGARASKISAVWKIQRNSQPCDGEVLSSPVFGRDGRLWIIYFTPGQENSKSQFSVQLVDGDDEDGEKFAAKVTLSVDDAAAQFHEEEFHYLTTTENFNFEVGRSCVVRCLIEYRL